MPEASAWLVVRLLIPVGIYVLSSALDDLAVDLLWLWRLAREALRGVAAAQPVASRAERPIAVVIPCWREAEVIGDMLDHNLAALRYSRYRVLVGVYPNDAPTLAAARAAAARHARVGVVVLPHDGPTSKADCLNWVCRALDEEERALGEPFLCLVQHDAEDLIHPDELNLFNARIDEAHFLQLPVVALPTPSWELTHGVYCDDFAESQGKDLVTRQLTGAFVPGCGVGTALRRDALRSLEAGTGSVFDATSVTEDYDLGLRLHRLGLRQLFLPLCFDRNGPIATREYFPRRWSQAVRQRSRWIAGNSLQGWERHGWGRGWAERWFLWRDRKGLWGNPISIFCNLTLLYGLFTYAIDVATGRPWALAAILSARPWLGAVLTVNMALLVVRLAVRQAASAQIYGPRFALLVPVRLLWGNVLNAAATLRALHTWGAAKWRGARLAWVKTSHDYPTLGSLQTHKRSLAEVLELLGAGPARAFEEALRGRPSGVAEGDFLLAQALVREPDLMAALCLQQSLPRATVSPSEIEWRILRLLPRATAAQWRAVAFRVDAGALCVATADVPTDAMLADLRRQTNLEVRLHLISPRELAALRAAAG
jgi:adsorption protein B